MKKYLHLVFLFFKYSLMRDMEFRFNLLAWMVITLFWAGLIIYSVELIFGQVQLIAGWDKNRIMLLTICYAMFNSCLWLFIMPSLNKFSEMVRQGRLDFVLVRPINSRFLLSISSFEFDQYIRLGLLIIVFLSAAGKVGPIELIKWFEFGILFGFGLWIFYNLYFIWVTANIWFTNLTNLEWLFEEVVDLGRSPLQVFKGGLFLFFLLILPIGFVGFFPVQALFGEAQWPVFTFALSMGVGLYLLSEWFWNFSLKHYSSASS